MGAAAAETSAAGCPPERTGLSKTRLSMGGAGEAAVGSGAGEIPVADVSADVEVIPPDRINEAYGRTLASDVRYRFVVDMKAL